MHRFLLLFGNFIGKYLLELNIANNEKMVIEENNYFIQIFKMEISPILVSFEINISKGSSYLGSLFVDCIHGIKVDPKDKKKIVREAFLMSQLSEARELKWRMRKFNSKLIYSIKDIKNIILFKHNEINKKV